MGYSHLEPWRDILEATFYGILRLRGVYPSEFFERRLMFGVVVYRARHTQLRKYVEKLVSGIVRCVHEGTIDKILFTIVSNEGQAQEQYAFDVQAPPRAPFQSEGNISYTDSNLRQALRSYINGTSRAAKILPHLPMSCTFKVSVHVRGSTLSHVNPERAITSVECKSEICSLSGKHVFAASEGFPALKGEGEPLIIIPLTVEIRGAFPFRAIYVLVSHQTS